MRPAERQRAYGNKLSPPRLQPFLGHRRTPWLVFKSRQNAYLSTLSLSAALSARSMDLRVLGRGACRPVSILATVRRFIRARLASSTCVQPSRPRAAFMYEPSIRSTFYVARLLMAKWSRCIAQRDNPF